MKKYQICVLPGDGIGPEVTREALRVLEDAARRCAFELHVTEALIGGAAYEATGKMLPKESLEAAQAAQAVLLGAVGGPAWDKLPAKERTETALLEIRSAMGLYANLRPAYLFKSLAAACPLRADKCAEGFDMMIVRELTGGIYFGKRGRSLVDGEELAYDTEQYARHEIERIARLGFTIARQRRKKLTSVDKANVLESSRLWRETVSELAAEYPEVTVDHLYVDNAAMQLIRRPASFDVLLTSNMFGDILSDEAAEISGSIGLMPSASLGDPGKPGLYEPVHGSAPDIAGMNRANPLATILSAALLCRYSLHEPEAAALIEAAVQEVLDLGYRCRDLLEGEDAEEGSAKQLTCTAMGDIVLKTMK